MLRYMSLVGQNNLPLSSYGIVVCLDDPFSELLSLRPYLQMPLAKECRIDFNNLDKTYTSHLLGLTYPFPINKKTSASSIIWSFIEEPHPKPFQVSQNGGGCFEDNKVVVGNIS
jgi:hypothetical protein